MKYPLKYFRKVLYIFWYFVYQHHFVDKDIFVGQNYIGRLSIKYSWTLVSFSLHHSCCIFSPKNMRFPSKCFSKNHQKKHQSCKLHWLNFVHLLVFCQPSAIFWQKYWDICTGHNWVVHRSNIHVALIFHQGRAWFLLLGFVGLVRKSTSIAW